MKIAGMQTATLLEADWYTFTELRLELAKHRGGKVPPRTLQWWMQQLKMKPNEHGFYETEDLKVLVRLVYWLKRCRSIEKFRNLILQEISNAD